MIFIFLFLLIKTCVCQIKTLSLTRTLIKTDSKYRDANLNWEITKNSISNGVNTKLLNITQGFIASDENSMEFQVIDISTPASPSLVGFLDLSADLNGIAYNSGLDIAVAASDNNSTELTIIIPQ